MVCHITINICDSIHRKGPVGSECKFLKIYLFIAVSWMAVFLALFWCKNCWNWTLCSQNMVISFKISQQTGEKLILRKRLFKFGDLCKVLEYKQFRSPLFHENRVFTSNPSRDLKSKYWRFHNMWNLKISRVWCDLRKPVTWCKINILSYWYHVKVWIILFQELFTWISSDINIKSYRCSKAIKNKEKH